MQMDGDPLRGRRGSGRRTGSSALLMKKPSSSTLSRMRAVHALRRVDMTVLNHSLTVVRIPSHVFVVSLLSCIIIWGSRYMHTPLHGIHSSNTRVPLLCMVGFL